MLDRYDQDLLLDYLEDELDADRRAQLEGMLTEDPELAALLTEMAQDRAALRSVPQAEAPAGLVHDATHAMERRMLLDDTAQDTGPIPLSRGRALATEPTRNVSWGRVVGLTGLAASVALAAAVLVIMFDDPLERTANELADNLPTETEDTDVDTNPVAGDLALAKPTDKNAALTHQSGSTDESLSAALASSPTDDAVQKSAEQLNESLILVDDPRHAGTPGSDASREKARDALTQAPVLALQPTAAISAIQSEQQLVLFSDSPEVSLEQLVGFCIDNGIPVVQSDPISNSPDNRVEFDQAVVRQAPFAPNDERQANADNNGTEYALLINEPQLNALVTNLNTINIDPTRAGKAALISNQAALLTDLPENRAQRHHHERDESTLDEQGWGHDAQPSQPIAQRQTRQLRSPDLGSADTNRRNNDNLQAQQQANYNRTAQSSTAADPLTTAPVRPEQNPNKDDVAQTNIEGVSPAVEEMLPETDKADHKAQAETRNAYQLDIGDDQVAPVTDAFRLEKAKQNLAIAPARGNWLSPHLPLANTTPLLLSWRGQQVDLATKLVPITIQRAETDKVNMMRMRQQVELANRLKKAAPDSDAAPEEAVQGKAGDLTDAKAKEADSPQADAPTKPIDPAE